ncbi:hypothetical protein LCGC14_0477010 [marine sediment metagenome]|uniref:Uncharacterized protein n=1 Tax=marine sediment metagenome TaxID=412755 RepID=A0A0F9SFR7_9ZZZZ
MKVLDWRNRGIVVDDGRITRVENWHTSDPTYGVFTDNGYLYLITKEEIEELHKAST